MSMGTRLVSVGTHMPDGWMPASEIADHSGIPEDVIVEREGRERAEE